MKLFKKMKDGGDESTVTGYWLIEWKKFFSIVLLKFEGQSREAYHEHAFNCINWLFKGKLKEERLLDIDPRDGLPNASWRKTYLPSWKPFIIRRADFHKVDSEGTSWLLSFRGPWADKWQEWLPEEARLRSLTHGRKEV